MDWQQSTWESAESVSSVKPMSHRHWAVYTGQGMGPVFQTVSVYVGDDWLLLVIHSEVKYSSRWAQAKLWLLQ